MATPNAFDEVVFVPFPPDVLARMPGLHDCVRILVNGVPLEELVLEPEEPVFEGLPLWTGPPRELFSRAPQHLLGQDDWWTESVYLEPTKSSTWEGVLPTGVVPLLADAGCALTECDALGARVTVGVHDVVWSDFTRGDGSGTEQRLGSRSLRFFRRQYEAAVRAVSDSA